MTGLHAGSPEKSALGNPWYPIRIQDQLQGLASHHVRWTIGDSRTSVSQSVSQISGSVSPGLHPKKVNRLLVKLDAKQARENESKSRRG